MTVPSWPTRCLTSKLTSKSLLKHPASLASPSVLARRKSVLYQPPPISVAHPPTISIEGTPCKTVDNFKYLGSVISNDGTLDREIKAVVSISLLYGCETWILYRRHMKQLNQFHMRSLQTIMKIKWPRTGFPTSKFSELLR